MNFTVRSTWPRFSSNAGGNLPYLGMPDYDSLRSDPRFQALVRRLKLPN